MQKPSLTPDVTIADIVSKLENPDAYVADVLGNMLDLKKTKGTAFVRIGTTGRGIAPHYRVSPDSRPMLDDLEGSFERGDLEALFVAFHGRRYKRLPWGSREMRRENWSSGQMSYDEV